MCVATAVNAVNVAAVVIVIVIVVIVVVDVVHHRVVSRMSGIKGLRGRRGWGLSHVRDVVVVVHHIRVIVQRFHFLGHHSQIRRRVRRRKRSGRRGVAVVRGLMKMSGNL